ncbi:hypothetical protein DB347_20220 [Opitutaceae bacterium EW11]|nr:hypothetical protein DB347_20220 [Opitutaceae bacterium EW11]
MRTLVRPSNRCTGIISFIRTMKIGLRIGETGGPDGYSAPLPRFGIYRMAKKSMKKAASGTKLGSLVKDSITGFTGIAIGRTEFGFGCVHIRIQAPGLTEAGTPIPVQTFDDQRVEVLAPPSKLWAEPVETPVKLGDVVRDSLTGVVGVATGKTVGLDGQINLFVEQVGLTADGEPKSPLYINAASVVVVDRRELKVSKDSVATSGGPMPREIVPLSAPH